MACLSEFQEVDQIYSQVIRRQAKVVAVCAANPQEGVSTVATALTLRFAKPGAKTLLVDMNYCRPAVDRIFKVQRTNWQCEPDAMKLAIRHCEERHIDILTASLQMDAKLRQEGQLKALLEAWSREYQVVVLDTSPINAVNRQNIAAEQVCALADSTVMVLRSGVTKEADILDALAKLNSHQVVPMGWIMNDIDCPSLSREIQRELARLSRFAPRLSRWIEQKITKSDLINQLI